LRAEIYNVNRPRDYAGYPVYWIGHAPGNESLLLLRSLLDANGSETVAVMVDAIGAHDDPSAAATLRDIIRNTRLERARTSAISWLGYLPDQTEFLTALVRDERESIRVRREAAEALGDSPDRAALPAMQNLYRAVTHREVKQELIEAIGDSTFEATAVSFIIDIAENEPIRELRHEAIEQLSDMPGERAIPALVQLYDKARDDESKEEILEALSDAEVEAAWHKLAAVAQREPSLKLRKLAIELLGESEDPGAVKLLEQLIR
jgi:HEAT repeat protein